MSCCIHRHISPVIWGRRYGWLSFFSVSPCPSLFPSSGIAGMVGYPSSPCRPVPHFSRHLRSPVWLVILLLHVALSLTSPVIWGRRYGCLSFLSMSPCPSLFPSSGIAGMVVYPSYPCRPVPHFSRHLGSPVWLFILLIHVALSLTFPVIWGRRYGWLSFFSMSPCPSLLPSSGVAGMVVYPSYPCRPVPHFSRHLGSPVWLVILLLHVALSLTSPVIWGRRYGCLSFLSMSPCPSLFPSSGIAGMVVYPSYPCRPVPHFSRHLGSPVWLVILLLHVALSLTSPVIWGRRYGCLSFLSMSPCPSLFPSSGIAGMVGYPSSPCRPVPHFSRHLGSPVWLFILLIHVALSLTSPVIWDRRYGWLSFFSVSPCPSLFPSSGIAGMVGYPSSPCRPVPHFSRHLGSPVWLFILLLYVALSLTFPVIWDRRYGCLSFFSMSPCPSLLPSSGVAGMVVYPSSLCRPVPHFSRHLRSPVWLVILLLRLALSLTSPVIWDRRYGCLSFFSMSPCPSLLPSSGVAGTVVYPSSLCRPVPHFSRHLGSPVWLFILLIHVALSLTSPVIWGRRYGCLSFFSMSPCPSLLPSSGVAGTVVYPSSLCRPVPHFSRHLGSPVWLFILLIHVALSLTSPVSWGRRYGW